MTTKTPRKVLQDMLEDLSEVNFDKFCRQLVDRREEPRVRRGRVQDKNFMDIADVLVTTFTEPGAVDVAVELLKQIDCHQDAEQLLKETSGKTPVPPRPIDEDHFVDKHQVQLKQRVTNVAPILDELLERKVISQETYDKIRALPTSQEKMRELYAVPLKAGRKCKDIFYQLLEKYESFLLDDLKS